VAIITVSPSFVAIIELGGTAMQPVSAEEGEDEEDEQLDEELDGLKMVAVVVVVVVEEEEEEDTRGAEIGVIGWVAEVDELAWETWETLKEAEWKLEGGALELWGFTILKLNWLEVRSAFTLPLWDCWGCRLDDGGGWVDSANKEENEVEEVVVELEVVEAIEELEKVEEVEQLELSKLRRKTLLLGSIWRMMDSVSCWVFLPSQSSSKAWSWVRFREPEAVAWLDAGCCCFPIVKWKTLSGFWVGLRRGLIAALVVVVVVVVVVVDADIGPRCCCW